MTPSVRTGTVSQIWLSPTNEEATDKHSFLIRDDSYVVSEAAFGRKIRLGQPVDLGPESVFSQDGWFGGYDQERWVDEFMFEAGSADTTDRVGRIRLWPGWKHVYSETKSGGTEYGIMAPGGAASSGEDTPLIIAEEGASGSSWEITIIKDDGDPFQVETLSSTGEQVTAISPIAHDGGGAGVTNGSFLVGTGRGEVYRLLQSGAFAKDANSPGADLAKPIGRHGMVAFNDAVFYGRGGQLWRRSHTGDGGSAQHTKVKEFTYLERIQGMSVWQNRLWFVGQTLNGRSYLFTSDGVTAVQVLGFPHGTNALVTCAHYGSLYIGTAKDQAPGGIEASGEVWRYNGSSLIKLWENADENVDAHPIRDLVSYDRFVAWPRYGSNSYEGRAGLWYYDAEEDAILEGPTLDMDPGSTGYRVTGLTVWNNTIAVGFKDLEDIAGDYPRMVAFVRRDGGLRFKQNASRPITAYPNGNSFKYEPSTITREVKSSSYDAELPVTEKVWLSGFVRCKVPANTQVRIEVSVDGEANIAATTITYNGNAGWRNVAFDLDDGAGGDLVGAELSYTVYVENTDSGNDDADDNPEVDHVAIEFMPVPDRHRIWHVRVLAQDGQTNLAGTPNALTTRQAIVDKLFEFWRHKGTLSFWEASANGTEPPNGNAIRVTISNIIDQPYRVSSEGSEVQSETSFSLLEAPRES